MELTPEERERIYLEEKARMEAREQLQYLHPQKIKKPWSAGKLIGIALIGGAALAIIVLFVVASVVSSPVSTPDRGQKGLRVTYWCANTFEDAAQLASSHGDVAAIEGMVSREKAFLVAEAAVGAKTS
jgi:hypothetical protein